LAKTATIRASDIDSLQLIDRLRTGYPLHWTACFCPHYELPYIACIDHPDGSPFFAGDYFRLRTRGNRQKRTEGRKKAAHRVSGQKAPDINHVLRKYYTWDETVTPIFRCCKGEEPVTEHVGGSKLEVF
jgi:hypothetical protein